jgi:hypothetical protein
LPDAAVKQPVVVLFHDVREITSLNLGDFIDTIEAAGTKLGFAVTFPKKKTEVEKAFNDFRRSNASRKYFVGNAKTRTKDECKKYYKTSAPSGSKA